MELANVSFSAATATSVRVGMKCKQKHLAARVAFEYLQNNPQAMKFGWVARRRVPRYDSLDSVKASVRCFS